MARDALKPAEYFEEYIIYQNTRIQKFTNTLNQLSDKAKTQRMQCCSYLANFYKDKLSAMYSYGNTKAELLSVFNSYMEYACNFSISSYSDLADILALMILFDDTNASHQKFVLSITDFDDPFVIQLKQSLLPGQDFAAHTKDLLYPVHYKEFLAILQENDLAKATLSLLDYMNNHWYESCQDLSWFDSHKGKENTYCGYWSWISAAIAKIKKMDLSFVRTGNYIPWELIK